MKVKIDPGQVSGSTGMPVVGFVTILLSCPFPRMGQETPAPLPAQGPGSDGPELQGASGGAATQACEGVTVPSTPSWVIAAQPPQGSQTQRTAAGPGEAVAAERVPREQRQAVEVQKTPAQSLRAIGPSNSPPLVEETLVNGVPTNREEPHSGTTAPATTQKALRIARKDEAETKIGRNALEPIPDPDRVAVEAHPAVPAAGPREVMPRPLQSPADRAPGGTATSWVSRMREPRGPEGRPEVRMLLEPSNLGSVWLRLVSAPKGLVASFRVSTQSALAAFRQGMGGLAQDLQRAGVAVDHLAVGLSLSWSGCQERQEPTSGGQARLETRGRVERQESAHGSPAVPAIQRGPGTSGLLDTIA